MQKTSDNKSKRVVAFPHMGNLYIPVSAMLRTMGAELLLPPENNSETLTIGTRHSIETVCLPYKMNLGNYIQALEAGANVLIMFQAPGSCRLGNYATMAEAKLKELGYEFEMVVFDMYKGKLKEVAKKFSHATGTKNILKTLRGIRIALAKISALDEVESRLLFLRPREYKKGSAENVYNHAKKEIHKADTIKDLKIALKKINKKYDEVDYDAKKDVLKVYLTGEFFVQLDPFTNMEIERELGSLGVEVERQVMFSHWSNNTLMPKFLQKEESHRDRSARMAKKYIKRAIGGECLESVGDVIYAADKNISGVIHVGPFNCNPEIVTQCILPNVSKLEDIPVISFAMDEMTGKAGLVTRLEAFVDLINRRRRSKKTA